MSGVEGEVRAAFDAFYAALNRVVNRDAGPMADAWWHTPDVSASHPMGDWTVGWDLLAVTWEEFARFFVRGTVEVENVTLHVVGDFAYAFNVEVVFLETPTGLIRFRSNATNVFRREAGAWRLVHHHADKAPVLEQSVPDAPALQAASGARGPAWRAARRGPGRCGGAQPSARRIARSTGQHASPGGASGVSAVGKSGGWAMNLGVLPRCSWAE